MKIMVFDVPADGGGALSVLNDFYMEALEHEDKKVKWIFVVSKPKLKETENIKVLRFPWVKKSWFHRLFFDYLISPGLIKKYNVDKILSLQNVVIPLLNFQQIVYVHQSLPFVDYKFTFKQNKLFWMYQNVIGKSIIKSIQKADQVIVQTKWMKDACKIVVKKDENKINIIPPKINIEPKFFFKLTKESCSTFFYPASEMEYKNHAIIIDACSKLKMMSMENYEVIFTLYGNENKHISNCKRLAEKVGLPIRFVGPMKREDVLDFYSKSILLFPSYIETFGLPLLEAKFHRGIIIASDCLFSKEILEGYENAYFFNPFNSQELLRYMKKSINGEIAYNEIKEYERSTLENDFNSIIDLVLK